MRSAGAGGRSDAGGVPRRNDEGAAAVGGRPLGKLPVAVRAHEAPTSPLATLTASIASSA